MPTARVFSYSDSKSPILAALFAAALLLFAAPQPTHAQTLTTLWSFTGGTGTNFGALLLDRSDSLYGTTFDAGFGTIFKVSSSGRYYLLHSFVFTDGCAPYGGLVRDNADNFYGTTSSCGHGTVFRYNALRKTFNVMYSFAGGADGAQPYSALLRDGAGNLYGTTNKGGAAGCAALGCGTVFKVTAAGVETVLYAFTGTTDGENPVGALVEDAAGNLYGPPDKAVPSAAAQCSNSLPQAPKLRSSALTLLTAAAPAPTVCCAMPKATSSARPPAAALLATAQSSSFRTRASRPSSTTSPEPLTAPILLAA